MKFEWRKKAKNIYLPKNKPELVTIPKFNFFMIEREGDPNSEEFSEAIGVLYSLSYVIKMLPKKRITPEGYFDYTVFPLEGIWDLAEETQGLSTLNKDKLIYTIMIRQPNFVTDTLAEEVFEIVKRKKTHPLLHKIKFKSLEDGPCVQIMHLGSYDKEPESFSIMEDFCIKNNLNRISKTHREIYISDPRRTKTDNLKTVLRFKVHENR